VLVIIAGALLFALGAPTIGRRLHPAAATRLLAVGAVLVAASTLSVAVLVALTGVGQEPAVAEFGEWSASALRADDPFPMTCAIACAVAVPLIAVALVVFLVRRSRALLIAYRSCRHLPEGPLVIVEHDRPEAFATPQPAGRIVMSTGMLRALTADERRVVLAHETAHLRHRHSWWRLAADLAATLNPILRATARTVAETIERWADEDAAHEVADRRLAARALARTALLTHEATMARPLDLAATGGDVPARVRALLRPPPPRRPGLIMATCALLAVLAATTVLVQFDGEELFNSASQPPSTVSFYRK